MSGEHSAAGPVPRTAELVLVTPGGTVVGRLPAVPVATPWWQDIEPIVRAARERYGVEVTILRLLEAEFDAPPGGRVTYLAEVARPVPAEPWHGTLDDQPRRELSSQDRATLARLARGLPDRFGQVADCGLDDTLVHGDFHPGNFRGDARGIILLDWGDSGVGHPLLDQPAFLSRIPNVDIVEAHWLQQWRDAIPGCDPARAARLLGPVAAARQAVIYRRFLDLIEPAEHPYHRADPAAWLRRTATFCAQDT